MKAASPLFDSEPNEWVRDEGSRKDKAVTEAEADADFEDANDFEVVSPSSVSKLVDPPQGDSGDEDHGEFEAKDERKSPTLGRFAPDEYDYAYEDDDYEPMSPALGASTKAEDNYEAEDNSDDNDEDFGGGSEPESPTSPDSPT